MLIMRSVGLKFVLRDHSFCLVHLYLYGDAWATVPAMPASYQRSLFASALEANQLTQHES